MKNLWCNYQVDKSEALRGELKSIHYEITEKTEAFIKTLTTEQQDLYEDILDSENRYRSISNKECFFDGLHFAITFLVEALKNT